MSEPPAGQPSDNDHDGQGVRPESRPSDARSGLLDPLLDSSQAGLLGGLAEADTPAVSASDGANADPWAHRRGEPRTFALLFCMYLLASAMLTIFATPVLGAVNSATFLNSSRMLLVLVAVATVVLWPMTRLSQAAPTRPVKAAAIDTAVVIFLMQAVLWPATILPGGAKISPAPWLGLWPWSVTAGLSLLYASWSILIGGILACALTGEAGWRRTAWTLVVLAMVAGGAVAVGVMSQAGLTPNAPWKLWSLFTAAPEFIVAPSGLTATMSRSEWLAVLAPAAVSVPWWMVARWRSRSRATHAA